MAPPSLFDRYGSGPAVVLVGGGPTNRYSNMGLAGLLGEQLSVFNYDRRAGGDRWRDNSRSVSVRL